MLVEGACAGILRVDSQSSKAGDVACLQRALHRVLKKAAAAPLLLEAEMNSHAGKEHDRNQVTGQALDQPLRCVGKATSPTTSE
jgi:hypothetical protein